MATGDDLGKWFEPGFDVTFQFPTVEYPKYKATIEEFDLSAEGDTPDEAYETVLNRVVSVVVARYLHGESLPDRITRRTQHAILSDGGDG
ncbi:MAG: hypothetical protein M3Y58_09990 [Chloroflexota bacterium]|nr:hypothetical protein [Chloroflexota bacterium]